MKTISNDTYVDQAEKVIRTLKEKKNPRNGRPVDMVTTSKLRNLLAMTADIYNEVRDVQEDKLPQRIQDRIAYLRVRFLYEAGRDDKVKNFVEESKILDVLKEIQGSKENYILFSRYMEALVAYHKFMGGKD